MPVQVKAVRRNGKIVGYRAHTGGKIHKTRKAAVAQARAIGLSKARAKGLKVPRRR